MNNSCLGRKVFLSVASLRKSHQKGHQISMKQRKRSDEVTGLSKPMTENCCATCLCCALLCCEWVIRDSVRISDAGLGSSALPEGCSVTPQCFSRTLLCFLRCSLLVVCVCGIGLLCEFCDLCFASDNLELFWSWKRFAYSKFFKSSSVGSKPLELWRKDG